MTHIKYNKKDLLTWAYSAIDYGLPALSKQIITVLILWGTDEAESLWMAKIVNSKPLHIIPEN